MSTNPGSPRFGPDWQMLAEAQKVELTPLMRERLEGIAKTMLGLRGLIDWREEPAISFRADEAHEEPAE